MKVYNDNDVVLTSRIRFARNLAEYPFASKCDATSAKEITEKIRAALGNEYNETDFTETDEITAGANVENHSVSRDFISTKLPHSLFTGDEGRVKIMTCEEDHIRLQAITKGFSLDEAYKLACKADDKLSKSLKIAYNERFGYLTHCPTNLGCAMRASVMMFLPALTIQNRIRGLVSQLSKLGLTIRGIYGEGSDALGCLYQISNQESLGISEEAIIAKLDEIISQMVKLERDARNALYNDSPDNITDRALRALGVFKYSHLLDSSEFMRCYSDVRLGISLDIIKDIDYESIDRAFIEVMPYTLMQHAGRKMNERERDLTRSKRIKELI